MTIGVPALVIDREAPDYAQHMTTDVNDVLNRITTSVNTAISDLEAAVAGIVTPTGWYKILTQSASGVATVDFTTSIDSTYTNYVFLISGLLSVSNPVNFTCQVSTDGGATWKNTAGDYFRSWNTVSGSTNTPSSNSIETAMMLISNLSNTEVVGGQLWLQAPSDTAHKKTLTWNLAYGGAAPSLVIGGGLFTGLAAITGFRFLMSSGNISAGNFTLYGVTK